MKKKLATAVVTVLMVGAGGVAAHAATSDPTPVEGVAAGGTSVTMRGPDGMAFVAVSAGGEHSLAIGGDGNAYAWGSNGYGQLGDGTSADSNLPTQVHTPAGVTFTQVSAGLYHSLAIGDDGNAYAWGQNLYGQVGDGTGAPQDTPTLVDAPADVAFTQISAGLYHSLAVGDNGNLYAWGQNGNGQLGDGTSMSQDSPILVSAPAEAAFTQVSAGGHHSLAIDTSGNAYAWGSNVYGQLGDGTRVFRDTPTLVDAPAEIAFTQISAGNFHSLAIGDDEKTYAWGSNEDGQLGDTSNINRHSPNPVPTPDDVVFARVSAGGYHSLATGYDGTTYAWGYNRFGQLGDGNTASRNKPAPVHTPEGAAAMRFSAGTFHSLAIDDDGTTFAWGDNEFGSLGDGTTVERLSPVAVAQDVVITGVTFGGLDAVSFSQNADSTVTAVTPAHVPGSVDVVINWTLNGVTQAPVTYAQGFMYVVDPPTLTDPSDQTVTDGDAAVFTVTATDAESVAWEVSADAGTTWQPITADPDATPSADGLALTVVGKLASNHGNHYRATATNTSATATSQAANLTVNARTHTVSFDRQNGTPVSEVSVTHGDLVPVPVNPTRAGYTFSGWFTDKDAATSYDFDALVTESISLYAGWAEAEVVVPPADTPPSAAALPLTGGVLPPWIPLTAVLLVVMGTGMLATRRVAQSRTE